MIKDIYLSIGTNLGDKQSNLKKAISELEKREILSYAVSSIYRSEAWGNDQLNDFLNLVLACKTNLTPHKLLEQIKEIEETMGRRPRKDEKGKTYEDRIIDIDIIFFGDKRIKSEALEIPHKLFQERNFVLNPLAEIAPDFKDPRSGKSIKVLLKNCKDLNKVEKDA